MKFAAAIKESAGERVLRCLQYFLRLLTFTFYQILLRSRSSVGSYMPFLQDTETKWKGRGGGFVNMHGLPGRDIPLDLLMEHFNHLAKGAMRNPPPYKTRQKSITKIGWYLVTLHPICEYFDSENWVHFGSSKPEKPSAVPGVSIEVNWYISWCILSHVTFFGRYIPSWKCSGEKLICNIEF